MLLVTVVLAAVLWPQLSSEAFSGQPVESSASSTTSSAGFGVQAAAAARVVIAGAAAELQALRRAADAVAHGVADRRAADGATGAEAARAGTEAALAGTDQAEKAPDEAARQTAAANAIEAQQSTPAPTSRPMAPPEPVAPAAAPAALPAAGSAKVDTAAETRFVALINDARAQAGLPALEVSGRLRAAAQSWASDLAYEDTLRHHDMQQFLDSWTLVGENMAFGPSVDSLFKAFMASSQHYANIGKAEFTSVGVGVVVGPDGTLWTSQIFAG
jgi:uncharacterized protein YkwD